MIGESSPTTHHTLSETDHNDNKNKNKSNNRFSSKSRNANGSSNDIISTNSNINSNDKDYSSTFSINGTYTINDSDVISHDNNNNKSNSLSNNTSYTTMDDAMPDAHHDHHINTEHDTLKGISFHPYDVSVQSSSETMTSTPTTTTFITQEYKNNSQATTKLTNAASLSTSTPTLMCDLVQHSHSAAQTHKALPTSEEKHSKRKMKQHTSKEHTTQANGVKVELHVATHSQNRSSCESIGLTQLPDSHQEEQHEQSKNTISESAISSAPANVTCKHSNEVPLKISHKDENNETIPCSSCIDLTTSTVKCKQSEESTDNVVNNIDKIQTSESEKSINNDKTNGKSNSNDDDDDDMINSSFETTIKAGSSTSSSLLESTLASNHLEQNSEVELSTLVNDINSMNSVHSYSIKEHLLANGECHNNHNYEANSEEHLLHKDSQVSEKEMSISVVNSTTKDHSVADTSASTTDKCESEFIREERANENESSNIFTERDANSLPSIVSSDATIRHVHEVQKKPEPGVAPRLDFPLSIDEAEMSTMIAVSRAGCNVREVIEILESIAEGKEGNERTPEEKMNGAISEFCGNSNGVITEQQQQEENNNTPSTLFFNKNNNNNRKNEKENKSRPRNRRGSNKANRKKVSNDNVNNKKATYDVANTNQTNKEMEEQENKSIAALSEQVTPTETLSTIDDCIL